MNSSSSVHRNRITLPKAINEKTNYIKAFVKEVASDSMLNLEDLELLTSAEYYYQQAKYDAQEAAKLWLASR